MLSAVGVAVRLSALSDWNAPGEFAWPGERAGSNQRPILLPAAKLPRNVVSKTVVDRNMRFNFLKPGHRKEKASAQPGHSRQHSPGE